ncbi:hypothetical protein RI054_22g97190 [Pseudoscourfieldia marina]
MATMMTMTVTTMTTMLTTCLLLVHFGSSSSHGPFRSGSVTLVHAQVAGYTCGVDASCGLCVENPKFPADQDAKSEICCCDASCVETGDCCTSQASVEIICGGNNNNNNDAAPASPPPPTPPPVTPPTAVNSPPPMPPPPPVMSPPPPTPPPPPPPVAASPPPSEPPSVEEPTPTSSSLTNSPDNNNSDASPSPLLPTPPLLPPQKNQKPPPPSLSALPKDTLELIGCPNGDCSSLSDDELETAIKNVEALIGLQEDKPEGGNVGAPPPQQPQLPLPTTPQMPLPTTPQMPLPTTPQPLLLPPPPQQSNNPPSDNSSTCLGCVFSFVEIEGKVKCMTCPGIGLFCDVCSNGERANPTMAPASPKSNT